MRFYQIKYRYIIHDLLVKQTLKSSIFRVLLEQKRILFKNEIDFDIFFKSNLNTMLFSLREVNRFHIIKLYAYLGQILPGFQIKDFVTFDE